MKIKRLALCGIFTAIALTIFVLEAQIPPPVPIPGIKLGLSNVVTLFALLYMAPKEALLILLARILLGSFFVGNPSILLYSLIGGLGCLWIEAFLLARLGEKNIWAVSALGALVHNTLQLLVASLMVGSFDIFMLLPILWISAVFTGLFTGLCIFFLHKRRGDWFKKLLQ